MDIVKSYLTINPYSRCGRKLKSVSKIVVHYVGNANTSALANRNYFESLKDKKQHKASSHYIIGLLGEVLACVPEGEVAFHAGDREMNDNSIGIECCHTDLLAQFTESTYQSLVSLLTELCEGYNLNPMEDIIRHYDVTGKKCPLFYVNNEKNFIRLKEDVAKQMERKTIPIKVGNMQLTGVYLEDGKVYCSVRGLGECLGNEVNWQEGAIEVKPRETKKREDEV